jgi:hypothetical protein
MHTSGRIRKRRLTAKQAHYVRELTEAFIRTLLEFKFESDITKYLIEKARFDWREVRDNIDRSTSVKGCGLLFRS